jgi:hypothetical protein
MSYGSQRRIKISCSPFAKEGHTPLNPLLIEGKHTSLWQREVRRDFI